MKQERFFREEYNIAKKLLKADYQLCLTVMTMELGSKERAITRLRWLWKDYYFSIARHNKMIAS